MNASCLVNEPYYQPVGDECLLFEQALQDRVPVIVRGPTGCGKTRFVRHMAWRLHRPLVTVACHRGLTAVDLTGRWTDNGHGTYWQDGPLAKAARLGALCYLERADELAAEVLVVVHSLIDSRRELAHIRDEMLTGHPDFSLVMSWEAASPGDDMQTATLSSAGDSQPTVPTESQVHEAVADITDRMRSTTLQRFSVLQFGYAPPEAEAQVVVREADVSIDVAVGLVALGLRTRRMQGHGIKLGASTRLLINAGTLIRNGASPAEASRMAITLPLSEDPMLSHAFDGLIEASFCTVRSVPEMCATKLSHRVLHCELSAYLRMLWNVTPALTIQAPATEPQVAKANPAPPFLLGAGVYLPPSAPNHALLSDRHWYRAAVAHAAAHLVYSTHRFNLQGLEPLTIHLFGLLEDARVEWLACRELPGLHALWARLHTATPQLGDAVFSLVSRLERALIDVHYVDSHPWVIKGRTMFFLDKEQKSLALRSPTAIGDAAAILSNDVVNMNLVSNEPNIYVAANYRDDNRWLCQT